MKNAMLESLPNSQNDFMKLFNESSSQEEMQMATYLRAMQPDCFDRYVRRFVASPAVYDQDYIYYTQIDGKNKNEAYKKLREKYYEYFKTKERIEAENKSDRCFLEEMAMFFKEKGLLSQYRTCIERIETFVY